MRPGDSWLLPVRFSDCEIPDLDIGARRSLRSIQRADLFGDDADDGVRRLVASVLRVLERAADASAAQILGDTVALDSPTPPEARDDAPAAAQESRAADQDPPVADRARARSPDAELAAAPVTRTQDAPAGRSRTASEDSYPADPQDSVVARALSGEPQARQARAIAGPVVLALAATVVITVAIVVGIVTTSHGGADSLPTPSAMTAIAMPQKCTANGPVVFVVSGRQDSPAPALTGSMETAAVSAVTDGSPIGVVNLDGRPSLIYAGTFSGSSPPETSYQTAREMELRSQFLGSLAQTVSRVRAKVRDADVLDALEVAGDAVRASCGHGGTIYLADSGLQETGPLNFSKPGLLASSPAQVVAMLARAGDIPHLAGMTVVLVGIGDTALPQGLLNTRPQGNLINIWKAIAKAAGATHIQVDTQPRDVAAPTHVPPVQLVPTQ